VISALPIKLKEIKGVVERSDAAQSGDLLGTYSEALALTEQIGIKKEVVAGTWKSATTSFYERLYVEERLWGSTVVDRLSKQVHCSAMAFFGTARLMQLISDHPWLLVHLPRMEALYPEILSFPEIESAWLTGSRTLNMVIALSHFPCNVSKLTANRAMSAFRQDFLRAATIFPLCGYHAQTFGDYSVCQGRGAFSFRRESGATCSLEASSGAMSVQHWTFDSIRGGGNSGETLSHLHEAFANYVPQSKYLTCEERASLYLKVVNVPYKQIGQVLGILDSSVKTKVGRAKAKFGANRLNFPFAMLENKHEVGLLPQWILSRDFKGAPEFSHALRRSLADLKSK
jgi:DNA-binding CsgD family transcriptional regulator